jgi:opacity protein-like surface antigen
MFNFVAFLFGIKEFLFFLVRKIVYFCCSLKLTKMKKNILLAIAIFTVGFANAQKAEFGIKGGLNSSDFSGDTGRVDFKSRVGFNVGAFVAIKLSEKITLQPEILYSTQGAKNSNVTMIIMIDILTNADVKVNLSYINFPVMIKYYVADKFNLEVGPQIGFLTSAESSTYYDVSSQAVDEDIKDSFESVDFGLNFGAGYDFTKNISAGIRYNLGLANISKTQSVDNSKIHNNVFSLSLGYKF